MSEKYPQPSDIPQSLWDGESNLLSLPQPIGNAYLETLEMVMDLLEEASKVTSSEP